MKPTNEELEAMGFNPYADKQKADTLSQIPKIDTEIYHPVTKKFTDEVPPRIMGDTFKPTFDDLPTNPLQDFINDHKANGFTFDNGTLTKHTTSYEPVAEHFDQKYIMETENGKVKITELNLKYDFLQDISDTLDILFKADLELNAIQNVAELILENGLRKVYREVTK